MLKKVSKIVVFILLTAIIFTSCEKKQVAEDTENKADNTEQRILDFKNKVESNLKSDDLITTEEGVWLIEALANYKYCMITDEQIEADLNTIIVDSLFVEVNVSNNQVYYSEVINTFLNAEEVLVSAFEELDYSIKFYDLVDVKFMNNGFKIYYTFIYNASSDKSIFPPIKNDWYWGEELGTCSGSNLGIDATDILYSRIGVPANQYHYFTDIDDILQRADYYLFATTNNPYGDYLMFIEDTPNFQTLSCIPADAMNYYVTGTQQALSILINQIPQGKSFKSWELLHFRGGPPFKCGHSAWIWYGIGHTHSTE